jgi:trimeric autotransporter adhesin
MRALWFRIFVFGLGVFGLNVAALAQPSVDGVVNATGYQTKLAPDTVFVVFGKNMGPAGVVLAAGPNYPDELSGTSISFTPAAGGQAITARMYYTVAGQVSGILPSSIPAGVYEVRVTYSGQVSPPFEVTVVARSFGIATANSSGSGPAQATIGNVNGGVSLVRYTSGSVAFGGYDWTLGPSHGGDTLVLWGTGGGADTANDSGGTSGDQTAAGNFSVLINGRQVRPLYAGASSGYPGLWQVNFTLPADVELSCYEPVQVSAGGELSNTVTIAIAAAGQTACADSNLGPGGLGKLDGGGSIVGGAFSVVRAVNTDPPVTQEFGSGGFFRWTAAAWTASAPTRPNLGQCSVYDRAYAVADGDPATPVRFLDAGARLPLSGPGLTIGAGLVSMATPLGASYALFPALNTFKEGRYTLSGNGGSEVGPFSVSANFPASFTVTNWDEITSIDRSKPVTLNWTGDPHDLTILISNTIQTGQQIHIVSIQCWVPAAPGTFTVPVSDVSRLLGPEAITVISVTAYNFELFNADLVGGGQIDFGSFSGALSVAKNLPVQ